MNENIQDIRSEVDHDMTPEWLELGTSAKTMATALEIRTIGTEYEADVRALSGKVAQLCEHVESIHGGVISLLNQLDHADISTDATEEIQAENVQIEREMHEFKGDTKENFRDVVKALFMWRDDPVERVQQKKAVGAK